MNKHVSLDDKLVALQTADTHRKWHSLDDQRVCILCEEVITGRMIDVWQGRDGAYHFHCPTAGCAASLRDWFYRGTGRSTRPQTVASRDPVLDFGYPGMVAP